MSLVPVGGEGANGTKKLRSWKLLIQSRKAL